MSTVSPLPNCPRCRGEGKVDDAFCSCIERDEDDWMEDDDSPAKINGLRSQDTK